MHRTARTPAPATLAQDETTLLADDAFTRDRCGPLSFTDEVLRRADLGTPILPGIDGEQEDDEDEEPFEATGPVRHRPYAIN